MSQKMSETIRQPATLDRSDERVRHDDNITGMVKAFFDRVRSGDLGMLPVFVGLIVISTVFSLLNPVFLAPNNLVNLLFDCATVGVISLGIVCVLMLGEIDLSVGSMSGLSSAILGVLWVNMGWPIPLAILVAIVAGIIVGALYAVLYNRLGMPSFVATLAGLLALLGMQLYILGPTGSINLPYASPLVRFGQILVMPDWLSTCSPCCRAWSLSSMKCESAASARPRISPRHRLALSRSRRSCSLPRWNLPSIISISAVACRGCSVSSSPLPSSSTTR